MKYVCDSCSAFKWMLTEADSDKAGRLWQNYTSGTNV
jgi:hypothetical protein